MNAPPGPLNSQDVIRTQDEIRGPAIGSAPKRERLLQRVRAARKRLAPIPGVIAKVR
jgi:hypothetical protein